MTGPGSSSASRMRIAGIVLLAIAGVAVVVGLISLAGGSSEPTSPTAAPTSVPAPAPAAPAPATPEVPLPGATGTTPPAPGAPGLAPAPGTPGGPLPGLAPGGTTGQPGAADPWGGAGQPGGAGSNGAPPVAAAPIVPPSDGGSDGGGGSGGGSGGSGGGSGSAGPVRTEVPVHVLNNSLIRGLAERAAEQIRARGWNVVQVGNLPNQLVPSSVVYYRPGSGDEGAARALASEFGIRVEGIANTRGLTVVTTSNWPQGSPKG